MSDKAFLVFAQLDYSHSGPEQGEGGCGRTSVLLGVADDKAIATQMIVLDHLDTLNDEDLDPLKYPLRHNSIETKQGPTATLAVTISGKDEVGTSWTNELNWYVVEISTNSLLEHFEL